MCVYENLKKLQLELPAPPPLGGVYVPVKQVGNLLFTAGQGSTQNGVPVVAGKAGADVSIETAQNGARIAALNMLSILHQYTGDLNRIKNVVKILGFVASAPGFGDQPKVMNAASQLLVDLFGEAGRHARSAIGVNELPGNITVEIEGVFELKD
ncbi:enamine deaminase RidA (YjgF/YER057c/UK114 family) [Hydrogenispora ethanolica]|uniref:Enamine deaminase RidA (YjgF/YER057c/UK114 family) n=1 Tax=Hydrogenispora ethanolica TaxID=1082276 RepID=A0A4R1RU53_HYDET|nr:RidA family protein [Hydrogenispora ethanolica]TCL70088.1 enamine deaminase RidA (YjgF/YER057c/UK114 family) [Hydrogenispora ethanolica]